MTVYRYEISGDSGDSNIDDTALTSQVQYSQSRVSSLHAHDSSPEVAHQYCQTQSQRKHLSLHVPRPPVRAMEVEVEKEISG